MEFIKNLEVWFVVGSQHLYGPETLNQVQQNAEEIVSYLNTQNLFLNIKLKTIVTTTEEANAICKQINDSENCVGVITWMHTFSPAKMWIHCLQNLQKPLLQLHTQYNKNIPWDKIDMDYMNLHQCAHGDREFGFMVSRLRLPRQIVVGYWQDTEVRNQLDKWMRVITAVYDQKHLKIARFGDNMRNVAVTEGDKVEAQIKLGYRVDGFGIYELVDAIDQSTQAEIDALLVEYEKTYDVADALKAGGAYRDSLIEAVKIELGLRKFLTAGNYHAIVDTFENLHGLRQLPGVAVQRLMAEGYGFGAEGDWKSAGLVRAFKVMGYGLPKGSSFMEDYTYDLDKGNEVVLGAHMLEVCPSIADAKVKLEIKPLGIGGKEDPVRLIFSGKAGQAVNAAIVDMGNRFRMVVAELDAVKEPHDMPNLPVGRVCWKLKPSYQVGVQAWELAGGAHHTAFSLDIDASMLKMYAEYLDIEFVHINEKTDLDSFKEKLFLRDMAYKVK